MNMPTRSEFYLSLPGDLTIGVASDRELELSSLNTLLLGAYLPEVRVDQSPKITDLMIIHTESDDRVLRVGQGEIEVRDKWDETMPDDLPHLLYSVARGIWLRRGYFPTHAACVGNKDFVLMPGHSGVGKTTTALTAITDFDQKLLSGNTTLVRFDESGMQAFAGTRTMTLRTEDFEQGNFETVRSVEYGDRTAFELSSDMQVSGQRAIGRIALVRLNGEEGTLTQLSDLSALNKLYPYFIDTEYTDCIIAGGGDVFIGETPEQSILFSNSFIMTFLIIVFCSIDSRAEDIASIADTCDAL